MLEAFVQSAFFSRVPELWASFLPGRLAQDMHLRDLAREPCEILPCENVCLCVYIPIYVFIHVCVNEMVICEREGVGEGPNLIPGGAVLT